MARLTKRKLAVLASALVLSLAGALAAAQGARETQGSGAGTLEAQLAAVAARLSAEQAQRAALATEERALPARIEERERALARDTRALVRLARGGLLHAAAGLEGWLTHASRVAHLERMAARTLAELAQLRAEQVRIASARGALEGRIEASEREQHALEELRRAVAAAQAEAEAVRDALVPAPPATPSGGRMRYGLSLVGPAASGSFARQEGALALPVGEVARVREAPPSPRALRFGAPAGSPVRAAADGRVTFVGPDPRKGLRVIVDHGDGYRTLYGGLTEADVEPGDAISKSARLGTLGADDLHFELRRGPRTLEARAWLEPL